MNTGAPDMEFQALARTRYAGNPQALSELGARLLVGRDAPRSPVDGALVIQAAADEGYAKAWCQIAVLAAAGVGRAQSWGDAYAALHRAAALGEADATAQLQLLRSAGVDSAENVVPWLAAGSMRTLLNSPCFVALPDLIAPQLCKYLMAVAAPKLIRAQVFDARRGMLKADSMRTNTGAAFSVTDTDLVMQMIRARIARAAAVAVETLEPSEVLHYERGEKYNPHIDFFHPSLANYAEEMRLRGQRVKTCLVYLNDDYEGGETDFPKLGIRFRGAVGEALIFDNVAANGSGDMNTLHAGLQPKRGVKWLLSQWIRNKPQQVV